MSKHRLTLAVTAAGLALVAPFAVASASPQTAKPAGPTPAVDTCVNSGAGATLIHYCITPNGTVSSFRTGLSSESIAIGVTVEGYVVCSTGGSNAFDITHGASGFGAPIQTAVNPLTISRTTTDGRFNLSQQFFTDTQNGGVRIQMTLKNLTGATITGVKLARVGDIDANGFVTNAGILGGDSVTQTAAGVGVSMRSLTYPTPHLVTLENFSGIDTPSCNPVLPVASPTASDDLGGRIAFTFGNLNAGVSKLAKVAYIRA